MMNEAIIPMHYYQFNIGDYTSHTAHLDDLEDLAYRRMLDYCYLNECGLPETVNEVARVIRMRTHSDCIANVLHEFFYQHSDMTWRNKRIDDEIAAYKGKSVKAQNAARKRWQNVDANALQTHSERNAKHKPLNNNHKPLTIVKEKAGQRFTPPTLSEVIDYCNERGNHVDPQRFINHYSANGWMRGKNKIKDWKACVRTWEQNDNQTTAVKVVETYEDTVARLSDRSWAK
jgi:uncharacterized protein YdaU (DUF1376 family)